MLTVADAVKIAGVQAMAESRHLQLVSGYSRVLCGPEASAVGIALAHALRPRQTREDRHLHMGSTRSLRRRSDHAFESADA